MSIELSNVKEEKSSSFAIDVAMPDLRQKSSAIQIDTKNSMEAKKKEEIKKKEPEPKFFYELLEEAAKKGIKPRVHYYRSNNNMSCPIAIVLELLGEPVIGDKDDSCGCTIIHRAMINALREKKVKFMDRIMDYCPVCAEENDCDDDEGECGIPCGHSGEKGFTEPMLAVHISRWHGKGNLETAMILKELTKGNKKIKMLPKQEPSTRLTEPMFTHEPSTVTLRPTWNVSGTLSNEPVMRMPRLAYIKNEQTGNIELRDENGKLWKL